ncbi:hypothetical protein HBB16_14545 [Pseudonocardia sp. MCCB 268]|nr:hypothetical protein [Pseudonocardia cytotoxica]
MRDVGAGRGAGVTASVLAPLERAAGYQRGGTGCARSARFVPSMPRFLALADGGRGTGRRPGPGRGRGEPGRPADQPGAGTRCGARSRGAGRRRGVPLFSPVAARPRALAARAAGSCLRRSGTP